MIQVLKKKGKKIHMAGLSDYLTWPDEGRSEVIECIAYNKTTSPSSRHQVIAGNFSRIIGNKLVGKQCKAFIAPLDEYNFIQP